MLSEAMGCVCVGVFVCVAVATTPNAGMIGTDLGEELPLCCCRVETPPGGGSLSTLDQTCMAMESTDGMVKVTFMCPRLKMLDERPS